MQPIQKFQNLLKRLFQFEASDLDFGIYRILNYKRDGVEKFIQKDLKDKVETAFAKHKDERLTDINRKFEEAKVKFGDDYLLIYSPIKKQEKASYLLNIDSFKKPFADKLKVNLEEVGEPQEVVVDIPETFNYLLGFKVKKIKSRNNGRKYLFILGEKQGKDITIAWREYDDKWSDEDFKKDKEFIIQELKPWAPHILYVNGQSILTPKFGEHTTEIRYVEPEFKKLMEK